MTYIDACLLAQDIEQSERLVEKWLIAIRKNQSLNPAAKASKEKTIQKINFVVQACDGLPAILHVRSIGAKGWMDEEISSRITEEVKMAANDLAIDLKPVMLKPDMYHITRLINTILQL